MFGGCPGAPKSHMSGEWSKIANPVLIELGEEGGEGGGRGKGLEGGRGIGERKEGWRKGRGGGGGMVGKGRKERKGEREKGEGSREKNRKEKWTF